MTPEISEFSYGFALTNELVGWTPLNAAPIFPSLIEEGKADGGYDVKFDKPGAPLFLQFKRSDCMKYRSAREIKKYGLPLVPDFYRFPITARKKSFQHTSLVTLDDGINEVFYVAPRFHKHSEINDAWAKQKVAERSVFVPPSAIGLIYDDDAHYVSFDENRTFFCSEPKEIDALSIEDLRSRLTEKIQKDERPLRETAVEWRNNIRTRVENARETQSKLDKEMGQLSEPESHPRIRRRSPPPTMEIRPEKELSEERRVVRELADDAQRYFNAQLVVVQKVD